MKRSTGAVLLAFLSLGFFAGGCGDQKLGPSEGGPPALKVESVEDRNLFRVEHPERFPLTKAVEHVASSELRATGTVNPDISRTVPVISIATGRVLEIKARLGDVVQKGQLLLRVQSADIAGAFSD
jgi:membrane fusion protein, heavy metal efflux system